MKSIQTLNAPQAIGTYSQAILHENTVYLSGQIPLRPETMTMCSENFDEQIEQVIRNLAAVCDAAGGSLCQIVKLTVYLTDLSNFSKVNESMLRHFEAPYPARAVLGVSALPRGAQVEIEAVMALG